MAKDSNYMGFAALKDKLQSRGGVSDPGAVAASVGRKKYGTARFNKAASQGRPMKGMPTDRKMGR